MVPGRYRSSSSMRTSAMQQPPSSSLLPHPSQIGEGSFAQMLYKIPGYRYAHTLAFLALFSPSAEKKIVRAFKEVKGRCWHAELPPISDFRNQGTSADNSEHQWWDFTHDLREMGLGWAEQQFRPLPVVQAPVADSIGSQAENISATDGAANGSDTEPDSEMEAIAERYLRAKAKRAKAAVHRTQQSRQTLLEIVSDDGRAVGKAAAHTERIPCQPLAGSDTEGDTEEDSEPERVAERYSKRHSRPSVPRSSAAIPERVDYGPVDVKRILHRHGIAPPPPKEGWPSFDPEAEVEYPTLPSLPSFPSGNQPLVAPPVPSRPIPNIAPDPKLPPLQAPTPGGYLATYRPRRPHDTMFHHGSAGVDPNGAHARPAFKMPSVPSKETLGMKGVLRHHRIVSGSFGSFETEKPNRFNDRPYRLFVERQKKKYDRKDGTQPMEE